MSYIFQEISSEVIRHSRRLRRQCSDTSLIAGDLDNTHENAAALEKYQQMRWQRHDQRIRTDFLPVSLILFSLLRCASAEDAADDNFSEDYTDKEMHEEGYMVVHSLVFGFFITLFAAFVAYFSFKEDMLMRQYHREGQVVLGDIVSCEFARARSKVGFSSGGKHLAEYVVFVEYDQVISDGYVGRVRKQVKAIETDFVSKGSHLNSTEAPSTNAIDVYCLHEATNGVSTNNEALLDEANHLQIRVLPDFPKSGIPAKQLKRATGLKHRLSTLALIVFDVALSGFCIRLAILGLASKNEQYGWYAAKIFLVLFVLEVPIIHCSLGKWFSQVLKEEYLVSGEYISRGHDDCSSISTGRDAYLFNQSSRSLWSTTAQSPLA